ncbi:MAG: LPP20 family lipoprotein, partial [Candidatus Cloacimonetes bacterium]|nr:LPP20 family lipoprotein [Candidatus Cloacimonadota bacterium]
MKSKIRLFVLVCLIFQFNLLLAKKVPDWVKNRPLSKEYYIGIGYAPKVKRSKDHIEIAKSEALKNLASEITINISGEVISSIMEKSGVLEEELKSQIRSTTQAELEGYELVDTWQNKKEYWVYYRLYRMMYKKLKQEKIDKAMNLALDLFKEAKSNEEKKNIEKALLYFLQALNPIEKYITETLETTFKGTTIYLNNEIYFSIQNLLSNIELKPLNPNMNAKINK